MLLSTMRTVRENVVNSVFEARAASETLSLPSLPRFLVSLQPFYSPYQIHHILISLVVLTKPRRYAGFSLRLLKRRSLVQERKSPPAL